jgi:hypothetical protein
MAGETALQVALSVVAWASLAIFVVGFIVGATLLPTSYRTALAVLFSATVGGFVFSFLTGFSIGRFTVVLPLVSTAFAVSYGRGRLLRGLAHAAAILIYVLLAWIVVATGWGIPIELPLCALAYVLALLRPPSPRVQVKQPAPTRTTG